MKLALLRCDFLTLVAAAACPAHSDDIAKTPRHFTTVAELSSDFIPCTRRTSRKRAKNLIPGISASRRTFGQVAIAASYLFESFTPGVLSSDCFLE